MRVFVQRYLWIIILAILCPIVVNIILSISTCFKVYENGWLGFWGSFIGALFPFIILYKTIKENEKGRKAQAGVMKYQISRELLNELKKNIVVYYNVMNIYEIEMMALHPKDNISNSLNLIWHIIKETENAYQVLCLTLVDYTDPKEIEYKTFLDKFNLSYKGLLSDLAWFVDGKCSLNDYKDYIKKNGNVSIENLRIWKVIEEGDFDKETDDKTIMNELLERMEYKAIYIKSEDFIEYENDKMNRELDNSLEITYKL